MAGNTLNIRGLAKNGASVIESGYVRAVNTNRPSNVDVAQIGIYEDGATEAGRYDIWFTRQGTEDVFAVGDVFQLSVHRSLDEAESGASPIYPPKSLPAITQEQFDSSLVVYELQVAVNALPGVPIIRAEDNPRYTNKSDGVVDWIWVIPSDPEQENIHFQLEWSSDPTFPSVGTYHYTTNPKDDPVNDKSSSDRQYFAYEVAPGDPWTSFPATGVTKTEYGKKCRFRKSLPSDGIYYWRVRATDTADR
jgi:hypothetical protein